eukprot:TRINITY_DN2037_c0_g1_i3.p1 TRINITY_DN2037_c0_g1~~TRINITY_DN2037_c0_g1_i3.p1  ORF type:complete len:325 (-),score=59.84 TRINITY_DN2037_c0_g1_i3:128-1102(-)
MGRTALTSLIDKMNDPDAKHKPVRNILGTKEFGKSHILAAYVVQRMQACFRKEDRPVIFLANCLDFMDSEALYLRDAMALAFAGDDEQLKAIARLPTDIIPLLDWLKNKQFDVVVDQCNAMHEPCRSDDADSRKNMQAIVKQLGITAQESSGFVVHGFSANNEIIKLFKTKERSHLDVDWNGGLSSQEFTCWLAHMEMKSLTLGEKSAIADVTGQVPGYLSSFLKIRNGTVGEKVAEYARDLDNQVTTKLNRFLDDSKMKSGFLKVAAQLVRGARIDRSGEYWDHSFFYVEDGQSHGVCGVALRALMRELRLSLIHISEPTRPY